MRYARASFTRKLAGIWPTTKSYLDALRNPAASTHRQALGFFNRSVARPRYVYRKYQLVRGINGLTAQLDYLRGLDCSRDEIHFVCQERFESDWYELLQKFRLDPSAWNWTSARRQQRKAAATELQKAATNRRDEDLAMSMLTEADRDLVRRCLFPFDHVLWREQCGGRGRKPLRRI
jgi:hypothetical protein